MTSPGRTIKVNAGGASLLFDDQWMASNMLYRNGYVYVNRAYLEPNLYPGLSGGLGPTAINGLAKIDRNTGAEVNYWIPEDAVATYQIQAMTFDQNGTILGNSGLASSNFYDLFRYNDSSTTGFNSSILIHWQDPIGNAFADAPFMIAVDPTVTSSTSAYWTSGAGITTSSSPLVDIPPTGGPLQPYSTATPWVVVPTSMSPTAGALPLAITSLSEVPGSFLVSFANDPKIYRWDKRTTGTPFTPISTALDGANFPYKIAPGPGSSYYVLSVDNEILPNTNDVFPSYKNYNVIKGHIQNGLFVKDQVVVSGGS